MRRPGEPSPGLVVSGASVRDHVAAASHAAVTRRAGRSPKFTKCVLPALAGASHAVTQHGRDQGAIRGMLLAMSIVLDWDAEEIPEDVRERMPAELRSLPSGRYVLEPLDAAPQLTDEEEAGI